MSEQLPKAYEPAAIEEKWAEYWVREHLWDIPPADERDEKREGGSDPFTLLLPPPNVTGRLHMGHMLNQTEMDIIIRWHRMSGRTTLWVPGTDHAGIATQMMVERQLATEGKKRQELGREGHDDFSEMLALRHETEGGINPGGGKRAEWQRTNGPRLDEGGDFAKQVPCQFLVTVEDRVHRDDMERGIVPKRPQGDAGVLINVTLPDFHETAELGQAGQAFGERLVGGGESALCFAVFGFHGSCGLV